MRIILNHSGACSRNPTVKVFRLRSTFFFFFFGLGQAINSAPQFYHLKNYSACFLRLLSLNEIVHKTLRVVPGTSLVLLRCLLEQSITLSH